MDGAFVTCFWQRAIGALVLGHDLCVASLFRGSIENARNQSAAGFSGATE
jgi:hypothetical protein